MMGVNHVGPVLLTHELLPAIIQARGRIVNVASDAHMVQPPAWPMLHFSKENTEQKAKTSFCHMSTHPLTPHVI